MADLRLFMTSVLEQQPWLYDSKVIPMPWRQAEEDATNKKIQNKSLTLGFYSFDGLVSVGKKLLALKNSNAFVRFMPSRQSSAV